MVTRTIVVVALLIAVPSLSKAFEEGAEGFADTAPLSMDRPSRRAPERVPGTLPLVFFDPTEALPVSSDEVRVEVESVFRALGVAVAWREGRESPMTGGSDLQVIVLPSDRSGGGLSANTMGAVRKAEDAPRALWIFLPAVHTALGLSPRAGGVLSSADRAFLARALARVIAHETIHAVAPSLPHSRAGLMASRMNRKELLRDRVRIDDASRFALFAGLDTWASNPVTSKAAVPEILALEHP